MRRIPLSLLIAAACTAHAGQQSGGSDSGLLGGGWYIAPVGEVTYTGNAPGHLDYAGGFGLGIGKMLGDFNIEARPLWVHYSGNAATHGPRVDLSSDLWGGVVDAQYVFSRGAWQPYAVIAAGGATWGTAGVRSTRFLGEAGAGIQYAVTDTFLARADLRYRANLNTDGTGPGDQNGVVANLGIVLPID
ncbi:hypothetical protein [Methylococcus capsulatus]|uniref:hypothetical protein n=1 Tax=Methylococcus capsulatus TaxID=414 RepID=UPI001C52B045|nr:hypothetical protein [Methylococcus capsulatus]QXP89468.1 hypothetical protein KW114_10125 [Methylococcus capsulatus]